MILDIMSYSIMAVVAVMSVIVILVAVFPHRLHDSNDKCCD